MTGSSVDLVEPILKRHNGLHATVVPAYFLCPAEPHMTTNRDRLLALIRERALLRGDVVLASGQKSSFYVDGKMIEVSPLGAYLIGEVIFDEIAELDIDAIGGLAVGAVPVVTSIMVSCHNHGREHMEGFFVREEPKSHGTKKLIEGQLPENARVVIVDDVVTSGGSVLKAVEAAEERGAEVVLILSIVDRNAGATELFASKGYEYKAIFKKEEVLENVPAQ